MTDQRSAKDLLALIAGLDDELQSMQEAKQQIMDVMLPYQEKQRELRAELLALMESEGIDRVRGSGQVAVINHRVRFEIQNAYEARKWLEKSGMLMDHIKLDETRVKLTAHGIAIPGVVSSTVNELRITKKEQ